MNSIKIFICHSHQDEELARLLVKLITEWLQVPGGAIRCTSLPGYKYSIGSMPAEVITKEIQSVEFLILIASLESLKSEWVLCELGAVWGCKGFEQIIKPLFVSNLSDSDLPGPLKNISGRKLSDPTALMELIDEIKKKLVDWPGKSSIIEQHQALQELLQAERKYEELSKASSQPILKFVWKQDRVRKGWHLQNIGNGAAQGIELFRGNDLGNLEKCSGHNYPNYLASGVSLFLPWLQGNALAATYSDEHGRVYRIYAYNCINKIELPTAP